MSAPLPGSTPPPAASARGRGRLRREFIRSSQRVIRSDAILITVIAVSMTLSAFSIYQATRASDEAGNQLDQARIVHTEQSRQAGFLQTLVDHDVDVLRPACKAVVERDVARVSFLDNTLLDSARLPELVAANLTLDSLQPLLLGDRTATCAPTADSSPSYVIQRAQDRLLASGSIPGQPDASRLETRAAGYHLNERFLMAAGFLFASVVAAIIVIDQLGARLHRPGGLRSRAAHRWQYAFAAIGSGAFIAGVILLALNAVDWPFSVALGISLATLLVGQWLWLRRVRDRPPQTDRIRARWWAEVIGAFTLVIFTAAAVGLSLASIQERDANARADRQDVVAMDLQRVGQLQALRDLSAVSYAASLEAQDITSRQLAARGTESVDDSSRLAAMRDVSDERMRNTDQGLRDQTSATLADEASGLCAAPPAADARSPEELFAEFGQDPDAVMWHVLSQQLPAKSCDVVAALSRHEARIWSDHASTLTVALVVLGLAGFLLSLAASSERSSRSSRMLLLIGAAGTTLGLVLALVPAPAFLVGARVPDNASAQQFGTTVASGIQDPCAADPDELDRAIATFNDYGPAFQARAYYVNCAAAVHSWPAYSSDVDTASLRGILDDLTRALDRGPVTPQLVGELGWFEILRGIRDHDDDRQLWRGLKSTGSALAQIESSSLPTGQGVHILRFNRALAIAALGDSAVALREYQKAERCLDPAEACLGGGILDEDIVDDLRLGALADLELIGDRPGVDQNDVGDYRFAVLGLEPAGGSASIPDALKLDVFPQELQLSTTGGGELSPVGVVWYHRPDASTSWAVLPEPSANTMRGSYDLGGPASAGALLQSGEYRADVYSGGHRVVVLGKHTIDGGLARYESTRLGLSIVVPQEWLEWTNDGVEWHIGPDEATGITLRRVEGMVPDDVQPYLEEKLRDWPVTAADAGLTANPEGYFLGLSDVVVNGNDNVIEAAGMAPYASYPGCGGTLFLARVTPSATSPSAFDLFNSIVLTRAPDHLPATTGPIKAGGMSVSIPSYWDGAARPEGGIGNLISATDCYWDANLLVSADTYESEMAGRVDASIVDLTVDLPAFALESRSTLDAAGATEAEVIRYTWLPEGHTEPVRQWQIYTRRGDNQGLATITTRASDLDFYASDVELIIRSVAMFDE